MMMANDVAARILSFYNQEKRNLPWRKNMSAYRTLVSEVMLQQTRVDTVIPYFNRFMEKLPTIEDLSKVDDEELLKLWQGLGYYRRASNLKKAASYIVMHHNSIVPSTYKELLLVPGVGPYTAKAILSIAYNQDVVAVDGNVLRVFSRYFGIDQDIKLDSTKKEIEEKIIDFHPHHHASDFMQALMEIGAMICIPNGSPKCEVCPLNKECFAYINHQIDAFPLISKKEEKKIENHTIFRIHYQDFFLIEKRQDSLLNGLWQLPNIVGHLNKKEAESYLNSLGYQNFKLTKGTTHKHIFTHKIWNMISYDVELSEFNESLIPIIEIHQYYSIPSAYISFLPKK